MGFVPPSLSDHQGPAEGSAPPALTDKEQFASGDQHPEGFWSSFGSIMSPKAIGSAIGATVAPVPAMAAAFGSADRNSFPTKEDEANTAAGFKQAHSAAADALKKGDYLGAARVVQDLFLGEGIKEPVDQIEDQIGSGNYHGAAGSALGFISQFALAHGLGRLLNAGGSALTTNYKKADPVADLVPVYGPTDPRFPERAPVALADIKRSAGPITSNEHLASMSPDYKAGKALTDNRITWNGWKDPVQQAGFTASPQPIMDASESSLKAMSTPKQRAALLDEARQKLTQQPLTPNRLEELLQEKNGELAPFYSKDDSVKASAKQAGALTGRSQAFLEAQAQAIRDTLYKLLDPQNDGAGPREVQRRYGGLKMIIDEASNGSTRNRIKGETPGSTGSKSIKSAAALASLPGKVFKGDVEEGVHNITLPFTGTSDPLIARAFRNAPEYTPLPQPTPITSRYPQLTAARQIAAGPHITPPPAQFGSGIQQPQPDISWTQPPVGGTEHDIRGLLPESTAPFSGPEGKGGVITPDILGSASRGEGTPHRLISAPAPGEGLNSQDFTDPRTREILVGGTSGTEHGWLPSAAGQTASTVNEPAQIISKRGEPRASAEKLTPARPLSTSAAVDYLRKAGWDGTSHGMTAEIAQRARAAALADGYRISNGVTVK